MWLPPHGCRTSGYDPPGDDVAFTETSLSTPSRTCWLPDSMPRPNQVKPCARQFLQDFVLYRIDSRIGPDIQVIAPFDDPVADADDMATVQDEHLIRNFDVPKAVLTDQTVDLADDIVRAPDAQHRGAEGRIDTTEGTGKRAARLV